MIHNDACSDISRVFNAVNDKQSDNKISDLSIILGLAFAQTTASFVFFSLVIVTPKFLSSTSLLLFSAGQTIHRHFFFLKKKKRQKSFKNSYY